MAAALAVACVLGMACKKSATTPTSPDVTIVRFDAGERVASHAVNGFVVAVRSILATARSHTRLAVRADLTGQAISSVRDGVLLALPACDPTTIRYFNAQGQEQLFYDPATTTRATATGTCVNSGVTTIVDLVLDDMLASSPSFLVNGTTQTTYEGLVANGTLINVRVPKEGCAFPTAGDMTIRIDQTTIAIHFDGSTTVTGSYTVAGHTVTFSIPLSAC